MGDDTSADFRCGYVAVAGKPNVGKSTLVNRLLNFPLSVVTSKPQTTRHRILGILSEDAYQAVFLDSPGLMTPRYTLQKLMVRAAWAAIEEADTVLLMIEPRIGELHEGAGILKRIEYLKRKVILAINKIDLVVKSDLLPIIESYSHMSAFEEIIPISALKDDGLHELKRAIIGSLPHRPPYYPAGEVTDMPQRFFVSEIIRQKVFEQFGEEIPYSVAVVIDEYTERDGAKDFVRALVICERDSQKAMLIGKGGQALKRLGRSARADIEAFVGKGVYLELKAEVRKNWRKDEDMIKRLGRG